GGVVDAVHHERAVAGRVLVDVSLVELLGIIGDGVRDLRVAQGDSVGTGRLALALAGEFVVGYPHLLDLLPAHGTGYLVDVFTALQGLGVGDQVLDGDRVPVLPHRVRVVLHRDDLRILAGHLGGDQVVRVQLPLAVLGEDDARADHRIDDPAAIHEGTIG